MIKRIVELSSDPAYLHLKNGQMVIKRESYENVIVPLEDVGLLIISQQYSTLSSGLLAACLEKNIAVIICDGKHHPAGMLLPVSGHSTQTQNIAIQVESSLPIQKKLWQQIIRAKLKAQAKMLKTAGKENGAILEWVKLVRSGDPANVEARAARFYWPRLFGKTFRRERDGPIPNALLNYGYAIARASIARAIVGAGLHPSIGIHHKNKYNDFCLADDLLEPLRPMVDEKVWIIWKENSAAEVDKTAKKALLGLLTETVNINGKSEAFLPALHHYAASFRESLSNGSKLRIPEC